MRTTKIAALLLTGLLLGCPGGGDSAPAAGGGSGGADSGESGSTMNDTAKPTAPGDGAGAWTEVVSDFRATTAMTALGGQLYVICNGLYKVDPASGEYERLGDGGWDGTRCMVALDGKLYMHQEQTIYRVDPADGSWEEVVSDFAATTAMAAMNGQLYAVCNGLYKVDPASGEYERLGDGGWDGTRCMVALGGKLYMHQEQTIYRVDPADGSWEEVVSDFAATTAMAASHGQLYAVCNGLYWIDTTSGEYERMGDGGWDGTYCMVGLGDDLYMHQEQTIYRVTR